MLQAEGVEGADEEVPGLGGSRQVGHAVPHFLGRLVGEGDRQEAEGGNVEFVEQPDDAVGDHPGLARSRARQDQGRASVMGHRLALFLV